MTSGANQERTGLARRVADLRAELLLREPAELAANTGADYGDGVFRLKVWNRPVTVTAQDFVARNDHSGEPCDELTQALLAYYFHFSNGAPVAGRWIAFSELPDGAFYTSAFQGYTGQKLAEWFDNDCEAFGRAASAAGGGPERGADSAYRFHALPNVPLAIFCWLGDEDFPPSYRILFDASAGNHLPTDACAILGSMLTSRLLSKVEERELSELI
jgi:Domain of unknown function (DUF3786)